MLENKIKLTKSRIKTIENGSESRSLTDVKCVESRCLNSKIRDLSRHHESLLRKKARNNLCKRNTRFFELSASLTNRRKFIDTVVIRENVISSPLDIKFQVEAFFSNLYGSNIIDRPYI
jgi:hypothetical protein